MCATAPNAIDGMRHFQAMPTHASRCPVALEAQVEEGMTSTMLCIGGALLDPSSLWVMLCTTDPHFNTEKEKPKCMRTCCFFWNRPSYVSNHMVRFFLAGGPELLDDDGCPVAFATVGFSIKRIIASGPILM